MTSPLLVARLTRAPSVRGPSKDRALLFLAAGSTHLRLPLVPLFALRLSRSGLPLSVTTLVFAVPRFPLDFSIDVSRFIYFVFLSASPLAVTLSRHLLEISFPGR